MKYEVNVIRKGIEVENYIATEYKTVSPKGRLGHKKEEREITEVNILPDGKKRNKNYSSVFGDTVIIKELETGRRVFTLKSKEY